MSGCDLIMGLQDSLQIRISVIKELKDPKIESRSGLKPFAGPKYILIFQIDHPAILPRFFRMMCDQKFSKIKNLSLALLLVADETALSD